MAEEEDLLPEPDPDSDLEEQDASLTLEEKVEGLVTFTLDKLATFAGRLDHLEKQRTTGPPPRMAALWEAATTSTPRTAFAAMPAFEAPSTLSDIKDGQLRETLSKQNVPARDRKELLTDAQLRYVYFFLEKHGPVTGESTLFNF